MEPLEPRRLLALPELDLTFGHGGIATPTGGDGNFMVVEELPDGKVLSAGGFDQPTVARFNADGSPDISFDGDGVLVLPPVQIGLVEDAAIAPDGKIVIVGPRRGRPVRPSASTPDGTVERHVRHRRIGHASVPRRRHLPHGRGSTRRQDRRQLRRRVGRQSRIVPPAPQHGRSVDNSFRGGLANGQPLPS
jgi:hypothetical protein